MHYGLTKNRRRDEVWSSENASATMAERWRCSTVTVSTKLSTGRGEKRWEDAAAHHEEARVLREGRGGSTATPLSAKFGDVPAVFRRFPVNGCSPASVIPREGGGRRGEGFCGRDWSAAARNGGNGGRRRELGFGGLGEEERERRHGTEGKRDRGEREATRHPRQPYLRPELARVARDALARSDPRGLGSLQREEGDDRKVSLPAP